MHTSHLHIPDSNTTCTNQQIYNKIHCNTVLSLSLKFTTLYVTFFLLLLPLSPISSLFPYTTLFRSLILYYMYHNPTFTKRNIFAIILALYFFFLRSEEHTSELQSRPHLVCRLLLEKKNASTKEQMRTSLHICTHHTYTYQTQIQHAQISRYTIRYIAIQY